MCIVCHVSVITDGMFCEVQKKLKTAYNHICNSDHPHRYIQLALVRHEMCNIRDKKLNEITRHTLQGQVDEILKIKEPLKTLEDVFHYGSLPCPRLLLVLGAPGNKQIQIHIAARCEYIDVYSAVV